MTYLDLIIETPNGFAQALMELLELGLEEYVKFDEDNMPVGLNKVSRFYPTVPTFYDPAILYVRGYNSDLQNMLVDSTDPDNPVARSFTNINILVQCVAGDEHTYKKVEGINTLVKNVGIYEKLQADTEALKAYKKYIFWPELLEDGSPNPKLIKTIEVDDGEGNLITINNPQYQPFRSMGCWA